MHSIVWTQDARHQLVAIARYIAVTVGNPQAARRIKDRVEHTMANLPANPYLYRSGRVPGTREAVVHPNYTVVYRVGIDEIEILAVLHARQQYP